MALIGPDGMKKQSLEKDIDPLRETKENLQQYILETIYTLLRNQDIPPTSLSKIGVAVPGVVQGKKAKQLWNLHIEEWDFSFLEKAYPHAHVQLRNDADAATLAEKRYGALQPYENALFLCLGTGIGGGCIQKGKLVLENTFEPGHMSIDKQGKKCACGSSGCFECYASMKYLKQRILEVFELDTHMSSKDIYAWIDNRKDNPLVMHVIEEYIQNVARGIANLCNLMAPDVICIGGSFVYYKDILLPILEKTLRTESYVFHANHMPLFVTAKLQNEAGILGSVL